MPRRLARLIPAALLSLAVLLSATAGPALAAEPGTLVLAAETGEGGEQPGPEPRDADNTENEFAPEAYEANWTALIAGRALFVLILGLAALIALGYWVRVGRFSRETRQS